MTDGLTWWQTTAFVVAFAIITVTLLWNVVLFWLARRRGLEVDGEPLTAGDRSDEFTWVFLVPALDEEVTIRDSVERLLSVECARRRIVVIDDGSTDRTSEILATIVHPDVAVVRRDPPEARTGKAAALNEAWRRLPDLVEDLDRDATIVVIVDADGRLATDAPRFVSEWFANPRVGGVQVSVRIYNRSGLLTRAQDVEFGIYARLYQAARARLGTAGMGGNGQFNRLRALDDLARVDGAPWRDRLTEDQDVGLRLLRVGWSCGHDTRTTVDQQGLSNVRRLLRQRTRWAQGNLQAMGQLKAITRIDRSLGARADLVLYLLQPVALALVGIAMVVALVSAIFGDVRFVPASVWAIGLAYVMGFAGTVLGCVARTGRGVSAWLVGLVLGTIYAMYTWLLWPVFARAAWRQLRADASWAKTEREQLDPTPR